MQLANIGRNEPCPCGSGRKCKRCCLSVKGAAFAVGPSVVAAVDRAFEDNDWEPLYDPIEAAMTVFERGAPLEHVRFAEDQMLLAYPMPPRWHSSALAAGSAAANARSRTC